MPLKQDVCTRIVRSLDGLADFTTAQCWRARDRDDTSLFIVSQLPVFSVHSERGWLIAVMMIGGGVLRQCPRFKIDAVLISDAARMSRRDATSVSPETLRSLNQRLTVGSIDLDTAYSEMLNAMKRVDLANKGSDYLRMPDTAVMPDLTPLEYDRLYRTQSAKVRQGISRKGYELMLAAMVGRGDVIVVVTDTDISLRPAATPQLVSCRVAREPRSH